MANEGFIKLYRQMLEWGWYDDGPTKDVFIHLLLIASYEDKAYRGIALERGQVVATVAEISKQTGLSRQQIRTAISKLISTSEVTTSKEGKYTVFTVKNYADYQATNQNSNQRATNEQPLSNHFSNTKKVRSKEYTPYNPPQGDEGVSVSKRFVPPTPEEVNVYCRERNNGIDGSEFCPFNRSSAFSAVPFSPVPFPCGNSRRSSRQGYTSLLPGHKSACGLCPGDCSARQGLDWS